jgi:hypothetical protein
MTHVLGSFVLVFNGSTQVLALVWINVNIFHNDCNVNDLTEL